MRSKACGWQLHQQDAPARSPARVARAPHLWSGPSAAPGYGGAWGPERLLICRAVFLKRFIIIIYLFEREHESRGGAAGDGEGASSRPC